MRLRWTVGLVAIAMIGVACGGGGGGGRDETGGAMAADKQQEQLLSFAQCMREHGVDMPDPEIDDDGLVMIGSGPDGADVSREDMEEAQQACQDLMPAMEEPTEKERAEMEDALLEFAECMRDHGIDMPDPSEGGFIGSTDGDEGDVGPAVDFDDPDFKAAQEACGDLLPGRPGGAKGDS